MEVQVWGSSGFRVKFRFRSLGRSGVGFAVLRFSTLDSWVSGFRLF